MCKTYDKSKGGDTRELQSRMVPPQKTGSSHLKYYFSENFRCNLTYHEESEKFSDFSLHCIFESENFRFPFLYEK